jgi:hypothetical protein
MHEWMKQALPDDAPVFAAAQVVAAEKPLYE